MKTAPFAAAIAALCLIGASAAADETLRATMPSVAWSRATFVKELEGKIAGAWATSAATACSGKPAVTYVETASLTRLQVAGKCQDGEELFLYMRRAGPAPAAQDACSFDYATIGGLIPGAFEEVTEKRVGPATMAELYKTLPNLRRAFATKQGGGYVALIGWTDLPAGSSSAEVESALVELAEQRKRTTAAQGAYSYAVDREFPAAIVATSNYEDGGKPLRDFSMDVIANEKCMFSIKFTGDRHADDARNWQVMQGEFARIRRVIRDHEHGLPTAVSGAR
ncbi:MAG TPA: hypothetical protein VEI03_10940 [Stellaceae bacterium]|nr:hypothetical protein [Stellaceae bacterium]